MNSMKKNSTEKQPDGSLKLFCDLSELEKIKECVFQLPAGQGEQRKIFLACEEIFSNIINYSGAEYVLFQCSKDSDRVDIVFKDNGKMFNPLENRTEKAFEDFDEGGMGISLVKELCSRISYSNTDGENVLNLEFADK